MNVRLSEKQKYVLTSGMKRINLLEGSVRSGKTWISLVMWPLFVASKPKDYEFLMVGRTLTTLHRNCLGLLQELEPTFKYSLSAKRGELYGRTIWLEGADNVQAESKIRGMTLGGAYVDELTLIPQGFYSMLLSRLSEPGARLIATTNPDSPNHYVHTEIIENDTIDKKITKFSFTDNTVLAEKNPEYIRELPKEYTGVFYQRYILGEWVQAEGLIYPMFQDAIEAVPDTPPRRYALSIDYGTQNAFAALLWSERAGVWYAEKEYYYSGRDQQRQKTDNEYYDDMIAFVGGLFDKPEKDDGKPHIDRIETIIDPSAASFIALLVRDRRFKVIPADNDVINGIRETGSAISKGLIKVSTDCENWKKEAAGYVWDAKQNEDRPVKVNDHCVIGETLVLTENGYKQIKDLIGTTGRVWSINVSTGEIELKEYFDVRKTQINVPTIGISVVGENELSHIICTPEHLILTRNGCKQAEYKQAKDIQPCDEIIRIGDYKGCKYVDLLCVREVYQSDNADVYNMEVDDNHNFAVNGGMIIHNCMDSTRYFVKTKRLVSRQKISYVSPIEGRRF